MDEDDLDPCEICKTKAKSFGTGRDAIGFDCPRCGQYTLTGTARAVISNVRKKVEQKLSGWVFDQNVAGSTPEITSETLKWIELQPNLKLIDKADRLLKAVVSLQKNYGQKVDPHYIRWVAAIHGKDIQEVYYVFQMLINEFGYMSAVSNKPTVSGGVKFVDLVVSPKGYAHVESLENETNESTQGFVAMWFDETVREAYNDGIKAAIHDAGFSPLRIDEKEHANKIDDEIIAEIRRSRFLVADFTGHRGGVYFEAGYALGIGLPIIWTCRKDHIAQLHFDIRQYNCIDWETIEELRSRLMQRIRALIIP